MPNNKGSSHNNRGGIGPFHPSRLHGNAGHQGASDQRHTHQDTHQRTQNAQPSNKVNMAHNPQDTDAVKPQREATRAELSDTTAAAKPVQSAQRPNDTTRRGTEAQPDTDAHDNENDTPKIKQPYVFPPRTPPKKFLPHEILVAIRRVQAGLPISELCRELGMSTSTFYKWRTKYNGMSDPLLLRLKRLQDHNDMLRRLYVDEKLRTETLQDTLQQCTHDKVAALQALEEARKQLEAYRSVTWTKKESEKGKPREAEGGNKGKRA